MPKHTFIDSILKRPSQSYAVPTPNSSGRSGASAAGWNAPSDLPNASGKPQSILAGSMFKSGGRGGLNRSGAASNAPSISGMSTTSRFSRFRKKERRPSVSNGSVFNDGASSVAPYAESNATFSPRKGRWWEAGSLKFGKSGSRAPSVAGSIFSEPEAPPASRMGSLAGVGAVAMPPRRGARSDYGGSSRTRLASATSAPPPMPTLASRQSLSRMQASSGVAPLGQQAPSLVRQGSFGAASNGHPTGPTSPAASMGRRQRTGGTQGGSQDWKSFVNSMAGTEVAKTWESMPTLAPSQEQQPVQTERRKSAVERVKKELDQEAQYEQLQREPGLARQDLLARAASQVIGDPPPLPSGGPLNLQPGSLVNPPIRPVIATQQIHSGYTSPSQSPVDSAPEATTYGFEKASVPLHVPATQAVPAPIQYYSEPSQTTPATQSLPPTAIPVYPTAVRALYQEPDTEPETESDTDSQSSDDDAMAQTQALDVVAEEEEDTSSTGHGRNHEMRNIQTVRGMSSTRRYNGYEAMLKHHRSNSSNAQGAEQSPTEITPRISVSQARSDSPENASAGGESQAESPLFKQPGSDAELTLSSLPPAAANAPALIKELPRDSNQYGDGNQDSDVPSTLPAKPASTVRTMTAAGSGQTVDTDAKTEDNNAVRADATPAVEDQGPAKGNALGLDAVRPPLLARHSSASDYRSVNSGRSTPTAKGVTFDGSDEEEAAEGGAKKARVEHQRDDKAAAKDDAEDDASSASSDTRSLSSRRAVSIRSSRSSRPATLTRRLSDLSLGTTFALSGIMGSRGRTSSRRVKLAGDDSDSPVDLSDDDADLKVRALAEQDRLRRMNVGDDFFGPSLSNILDRFDRMNRSDNTVDRLGLEARAVSVRRGDAASIRDAKYAEAQETINEIRQKRAQTGQDEDSKTKASSAGGLAPSFAALWLINQASEGEPSSSNAKREATDSTIPRSSSVSSSAQSPASKYASLFSFSTPPKSNASVLNRPRQRPARPQEMGGIAISEGKLLPDSPTAPPEDIRSTLPMSLSSSSAKLNAAKAQDAKPDKVKQPIVVGTASKDKPPPTKSAMKSLRHSKSLADTLFSLPLRSPESKAEKAEKKKDKSRRFSSGSDRGSSFLLGGKSKGKRDSKEKARKSIESQPRSSIASEQSQETISGAVSKRSVEPSAGVAPSVTSKAESVQSAEAAEPAVVSERAAGKRRQHEEAPALGDDAPKGLEGTPSQLPRFETRFELARETPAQSMADIRASESSARFETPDQSLAKIGQPVATPPQKFHTAKDLTALAGPGSPTPELPVKSEMEEGLSTQLEAMDGFSSFSLEGFTLKPDELKKKLEFDAATETGDNILGQQVETIAVQPAPDGLPTSAVVEGSTVRQTNQRPVHIDRGDSTGSESQDEGAPASTLFSDVSAASSAQTTPVSSEIQIKTEPARVSSVPREDANDVIRADATSTTKKLSMPPPPVPSEVDMLSVDDKTPTGNPPRVGINLIPPTPPALENRLSFTGAVAPTTPTIQEEDPLAPAQRPLLLSRSSSQKVHSKSSGDASKNASGPGEVLVRSKSVSAKKKPQWQEYHGKGLSLPPGLVATTVASSAERKAAPTPPSLNNLAVDGHSRKPSKKRSSALQTMPAASATPDVLPAIPEPGTMYEVGTIVSSRAAPALSASPVSPKSSKRRSKGSSPSISPSSSMSKIIAEAPPVPRIPEAFHSYSPVSSSASRFEAGSEAMSRGPSSSGASDAGSHSPAPSNVPSQSARSNVSRVSSSVPSASVRSSPRPEYSYVNHELSPYARKLRSLSPGVAPPIGATEPRRNSLMTSINEWESQMPTAGEERSASPLPPVSPSTGSRYPPLPASTVSRPNSVISSITSPSVVRNAPLGAPTNSYLQPPVAPSRISAADERTAMSVDGHAAMSLHGGNASVASFNSSPSASQSVMSLPSTMQTVPTSYRPNKEPKRFSAQAEELLSTRTTMQTIAVSSGAFANRSKSIGRKKQSGELHDKRSSLDIPENLQDELNLTTLSLTAHTPPPRKVNSTQLLVQVIAVAIDEMDRLLLRERVRHEDAFGFVPGRSFCGRVVECGYEVKKMRKGDVIFGLQDSRKSGALAEFLVIESGLVCHAPKDCLTTEQIAALPSAGVTAFQIVRNHCSQLPRGARVLILNAHDAIGLLTMQEAVGLGLIIVAQCPPSVSDGVAVCQANGAHEVVIGEPLWAINSLHESSFDLVVDTVGGRKIYDASRRVLAFEGQFTTCFGDEHTTANPNLKSHLRSLRRAFFKKDKKNIGYEWVGADTGEDCREALEAVTAAAEKGAICPRLRSVLPFGDAPRAFDPASRFLDEEPGAIVVRVS